MIRAHRIRLAPNNVQATCLARAAGVARFAYNWALDQWQQQYAAAKIDPALPKPNEAALRRQLNAIKRSDFPWMLEVTKNAPQMAVIHLGQAFENFFAKRSRYPTFRCKGRDDHFTITNDQFRVEEKRIRIPKLGWVRMREPLRLTGHIVSATIARHAGQWHVSIAVDMLEDPPLPQAENQGAVGVDLGINTLITLSTGEKFAGPKAMKTLGQRLRRLGRSLSRKVKGSSNRAKAKMKLARLHVRIADIRRNSQHQLTTSITRRFDTIVIEDLHVKGMLKNHRLARAIADMGFSEIRRQLTYKAARLGGTVVVADRWFASSRLCSACGFKLKKLDLGTRDWACPCCQAQHDRDINAAINLRNLAVSSTAFACGGAGAGQRENAGETGPGEAGIQRQESLTTVRFA
ncbi:MAG: transposase [Pseudomonadota bacterium]|nr:transposase [Pseudomonadota bacterium]